MIKIWKPRDTHQQLDCAPRKAVFSDHSWLGFTHTHTHTRQQSLTDQRRGTGEQEMLRAKSAPFITRGQPRGGPSHNSNTAQLERSFNCLTTDCQGRGRPRQGPSGGSWVPRSRNCTHRPRTGTQISLCLDPDRTVSIKTIDLMVYNNGITID